MADGNIASQGSDLIGHLGLSLTDPMRHAYNDVTYKCLGGKKAVLEN